MHNNRERRNGEGREINIEDQEKDISSVLLGNVLTSQRLCDVILKAFSACAGSQVYSVYIIPSCYI